MITKELTVELTDIQKQIWGCIFLGDYKEAARLANGSEENISVAFEAVFQDAYTEATTMIQKTATTHQSNIRQVRLEKIFLNE